MILGEVCTRRCSFCDVAHGRPKPPDAGEPLQPGPHRRRHGPALRGDHLGRPRRPARRRRPAFRRLHPRDARAVARHPRSRSSPRISAARAAWNARWRSWRPARRTCSTTTSKPCRDLYRNVRPGADYEWSLTLLQQLQGAAPGRADQERASCSASARRWSRCRPPCATCARTTSTWSPSASTCSPAPHHHPVLRYWTPDEFKALEDYGMALGFTHVASGPMVRSSYHADRQAAGIA